MTYSITKEHAFSASHVLSGLPEDHKCARMHGHNYRVMLLLAAPTVSPIGFVLDYGDMAPFFDYVDRAFDHRHLNDVVECNPTAENLAYVLAHMASVTLDLPGDVTISVGVSETPNTWAWWRAE